MAVIIQPLVLTGTLLFLYRFFLETIGVEKLGIWSLVLASTSISQIANMGISGGIVKFVAKYFSRCEQEKVNGVVQTALLVLSGVTGLVLLVSYPLCYYGLSYVVTSTSLPEALAVLPHALISVWIMLIGSVFQSCLDGIQRMDLRSTTQITGTLVYFVLCLLLVGGFGLPGLAWARIIQNLYLVILSYFLLNKYQPAISFFPLKWNKSLFKEMIGYGTSFQVMSFMGMLYDPTTKAILSKFGGLSLVGYYEMASRMVAQLQSVTTSANGVIVPVVAELQEKSPERIKHIYLASYQAMFYIALPSYSFVIMIIPYISNIWIGHYESSFVVFATLLTVGWLLNSLNNPAYFTYLGTGDLRWNTVSHITIAASNALLGILLGLMFGGAGVVAGRACSLAFGSFIITSSFHFKSGIPLKKLLPESSRLMFGLCILGVLVSIITNSLGYLNAGTITITYVSILVVFSILVTIVMWFHPIRYKIFSHLGECFRRTSIGLGMPRS